ncbi:hypothetical protein C0581_01935 [Candidatus Parcubacteria bacterium]|nr:MAG: hypothetical protein C0581_01935 [Candidatus Parcubacteria bacterium]
MENQLCDSCSLPLTPDVVAPKNVTQWKLCKYCVKDETGEMWSREEILTGIRDHFFIADQGMAEDAAQRAAEEALKKMPAWKDAE